MVWLAQMEHQEHQELKDLAEHQELKDLAEQVEPQEQVV